MALKVVRAPAVAANTPFTITVPGQELWAVQTVFAVVNRAAGGVPTRAYSLVITDGTNTLIRTPAADAGTEPGQCSVTWCNTSQGSVASGSVGVSVGPLNPITLPPGYAIVGSVLNGMAADQWVSAIAWVDEQPWF